jgi:hypothetical protein
MKIVIYMVKLCAGRRLCGEGGVLRRVVGGQPARVLVKSNDFKFATQGYVGVRATHT